MRYIKKYEKFKDAKVDDYLLLTKTATERYGMYPYCRVKFVEVILFGGMKIYEYNVDIINVGNKRGDFWITESDVKRKMTQEEIEKFNIMLTANKFNI